MRKTNAGKLLEKMSKDGYGRFVTVTFYKRSNGDLRTMTCKLNKNYTPKNPNATPKKRPDNNTVLVYDVTEQSFKTVGLEGVVALTFDGGTIS